MGAGGFGVGVGVGIGVAVGVGVGVAVAVGVGVGVATTLGAGDDCAVGDEPQAASRLAARPKQSRETLRDASRPG